MLRSLDRGAAMAKVAELLAEPPPDMRTALSDWARGQGVELD
jgi:phosphotransferase system enzyme I (PtsP)